MSNNCRLARSTTQERLEEKRAERVKLAQDAIARQLKLSQFAKELGCTESNLHAYFKRHAPGVIAAFKENPKANTRSLAEHKRFCQVYLEEEAKGQYGVIARTARRLGLSHTRIWQWKRDFAPDGVKQALEDFDMEGLD